MKLKRLKTKVISIMSCLVLTATTLSSQFAAIDASAAKVGKADEIMSTYLFEKGGTLDTLDLNIRTLPEVTYTNDMGFLGKSYVESIEDLDYTPIANYPTVPKISGCENGARVIWLQKTSAADDVSGKLGNLEIKALFKKCGTINGSRDINMEVTYSDIYHGAHEDGIFFSWTAPGNFDNNTYYNTNEFFACGVTDYNVKIRFYDSNTGDLIHLNNVFTTIYSLDGNYHADDSPYHLEAVSSDIADHAYVFENTYLKYMSNYKPPRFPNARSYDDTYFGGKAGSTSLKERLAICFEYDNTDAIDYYVHIMEGVYSWGYHLRFNTMTGQLPQNPTKRVSH